MKEVKVQVINGADKSFVREAAEPNPSNVYRNMAEDINNKIWWSRTPQGHEYWSKVSQELKNLAELCEGVGMTAVIDGKKYKLVETE